MATTFRVLAAVGAAMLAFAAPAAADESEYLGVVQPKFGAFLTTQQLLSEGNRVCAASKNGTIAPDLVTMVQNDLRVDGQKVAVGVAADIVAAAVVHYGC